MDNNAQGAGQGFFMMPANWRPGQPFMVPDPSDPTGQRMIEIPADQLQVVAEVPTPAAPPQIGADIGIDTSANQGLMGAKKGKKKKKKKKLSL